MNILTFFTENGIPKSGLLPSIKIVNITTETVIVLWENMDEISDGWYKYDFSAYDYKQEYIIIMDGGPELPGGERYNSASSDNSSNEISKIVWNAQKTSFLESGSFGESLNTIENDLKRTLGLLHENICIDNPIYDENNNLINARVRIYSTTESVGSDNNIIGRYLISSDGSAGPGKFNHWSQIKL
jgi:hypothetical protein